jgi:hypothetical protein
LNQINGAFLVIALASVAAILYILWDHRHYREQHNLQGAVSALKQHIDRLELDHFNRHHELLTLLRQLPSNTATKS